ncbi:MAG: purine-binding chemotaxis protein CheW [Magnetococcales bacterium]|nr:purine-binding chemotaxis protein CheW [Magnetococcales bacterium]
MVRQKGRQEEATTLQPRKECLEMGADRKGSSAETMDSHEDSERLFSEGEDVLALMVFSIGGHFFACHSAHVRELLPAQPITSVPGAPDFFLGVIDVRGTIESVIDLHHLLRLEKLQAARSRQRIVVANHEGIVSGFLVDSVEDILNMSPEELREVMFTLNEQVSTLATGQIPYRNGYAILLDMGRVFSRVGNRSDPDRNG